MPGTKTSGSRETKKSFNNVVDVSSVGLLPVDAKSSNIGAVWAQGSGHKMLPSLEVETLVFCGRCPFEMELGRGRVDQGHMPETHYVYVACCANGALYVGYPTHVERRMAAHNAGRGGRYTRANRPLALVAAWSFTSKGEALRAEGALKRLPRERKLAMIQMRHCSLETTHAGASSNTPEDV